MILGFALLLASSAREPLGGQCELTADCLRGSICDGGVCEYPGPCAVVTRDESGAVLMEETRWYDPQGRVRRREWDVPDAEDWLEVSTWKGHRVHSMTRYVANEPDIASRITYDRHGRHKRLEQGDSLDALTMVTEYRYDNPCGGAAFDWSDSATGDHGWRAVVCGETYPASATSWIHGTPPRRTQHRVYTIEGGRLTSTLFQTSEEHRTRVHFQRDSTGVQIGEAQDVDDDGTLDMVATWDLTCWEVTPKAVRYIGPPVP